LADINKNLNNTVPINNINLIEGKVEETLLNEENLPSKISILRLDTDWYSSTKVELEILYPRLMSGGFLIIDDYGHFKGCKKQ
jgi:O-methyltransferase